MAENIGDIVWFRADSSGLAAKFLTRILKQGPVPRHLACILDGNRTYSKSSGIDPLEGYVRGFHVLVDMINWCLLYQIKELSAFVFSIENFKRESGQVKRMFDLFKNIVVNIHQHMDEFNDHGISVRFIGDWSRISPRLQPLFAKVMLDTRDNHRFRINFAFVYTGRNEITRGVQKLWNAVNKAELAVGDLSVPLLDQVIHISSAQHPVDLLVRTSGCTRLSDYMMWQSTEAILHFVPVLWPDYTFWQFQKSIFFYQRQKVLLNRLGLPVAKKFNLDEAPENLKKFIQDTEDEYWAVLEKSALLFHPQLYMLPISNYYE